MRRPSKATADRAIGALKRMKEIARNEMMARGSYISEVTNLELARKGSVCGGHNACAIGSLWIGYGVPIQYGWSTAYPYLEGVSCSLDRQEFVAHRPGLKLALRALNDASVRWTMQNRPHELGTIQSRLWHDEVECLFESVLADAPAAELNRTMGDVIDSAIRQIRREVKA